MENRRNYVVEDATKQSLDNFRRLMAEIIIPVIKQLSQDNYDTTHREWVQTGVQHWAKAVAF